MTDAFCSNFISESIQLCLEDWQQIVLRGEFRNACSFTLDELSAYPPEASQTFQQALTTTVDRLADQSTWYDLSTSSLPTNLDSSLAPILQAAHHKTIRSRTLEDIKEVDGFRESISAFVLCWKHRPESRSALLAILWEMLLPIENWPRKAGEWSAIYLILEIAYDDEMPEDDALRLLSMIQIMLSKETFEQTHTSPLFLVIWNMAAVWHQRGPQTSFIGALPPDTYQNLLKILESRIGRRSNPEKLAQLRLAGLLGFLDHSNLNTLKVMIEPITGLKYIREEILNNQNSFIGNFFAFEGIALRMPRVKVFDSEVYSFLMAQYQNCEKQGPALQALKAHIEQEHRQRTSHRKSRIKTNGQSRSQHAQHQINADALKRPSKN